MSADPGTRDPQWEFTLAVRAALESCGRYVIEVDTRDAQALVDVQWAARQAGQLLGVRVVVELSPHYGHADSTATATVRWVETDGEERALAQAGMERLMQAVRAAHGAVSSAPDARRPRHVR